MSDPRVVCGGYTKYVIAKGSHCCCALEPQRVHCGRIIQAGNGRRVTGQCLACASIQAHEWALRDWFLEHHELYCTVPAKSRVDLWEGFYEPAAGTAGGVGAQAQPALPVKKEGE